VGSLILDFMCILILCIFMYRLFVLYFSLNKGREAPKRPPP